MKKQDKISKKFHSSKINTSQKYSRFIGLFFLTTSIPMGVVGLFNIAVDPYGVYNSPYFWNINHEKPKKDNNDRLYKATDIIRIKPKNIILGSSRTKQGIDPNHPALKDKSLTYNLAINGPNTYELRRYLEHAIANQKDLEMVVLGIDFFMFNSTLENQSSFSEKRLEKKYLDISDAIPTIFSLDTLATSMETVEVSRRTPNQNPDYGKNGFLPNRNANDGKTKLRFNGSIKLYFKLHSDYEFSAQYFEEFKKIVELCKRNGIDLRVFIPPAHATDNEAIRLTGQGQTLEEWKRKTVEIVPVWDFSGYNSVTTEPIEERMNNYADSSHFTKNIGNLILNRIFSYQEKTIPQDFGILLTPQNIETHLAKIQADREAWKKNNPDAVKLVQEVYQEHNFSQNTTNENE